jgi:hypothetical protein
MKVNLQRMEAKQAAKAHARLQANADRKESNRATLVVGSRSITPGTYAGATAGAVPKTEAKRNPAVLEMAQGRECMLRVPDVCTGDTATTVACHSNFAEHGKGKSRKADDCYATFGCAACHRWLDQGPAPIAAKRARFQLALLDQCIEWRRIASDPSEPVRFRKAAQWALDQLGAVPA